MNRAFPVLGLLLGMLAAAVVAVGVANDLERVNVRPTSIGGIELRAQAASHIPVPKFAAPRSIVQPVAFSSQVEPVVPIVVVVPQRALPIDWHAWTLKTMKVAPAAPEAVPAAPADAKPTAPDRSKPALVDVKTATPAAKPKSRPANTRPKSAKNVAARPRIHADYHRLPKLLVNGRAADTSRVDELISANDGINDAVDSKIVPYGYVRVGQQLVKLAQRPTDDGLGSTMWTGGLHYGASPRMTLAPVGWAQSFSRQPIERLPGEEVRLSNSDREAMVRAISDAANWGLRRLKSAMKSSHELAGAIEWMHRRLGDGWSDLSVYVKRRIWLTTVRPQKPAVHSAQLAPADNR